MSFNDPNISDEQRGYFKLGDTIVVKFSTLGKKEFQFFEKNIINNETISLVILLKDA
jgi:hypothetical protein